MIKKILPVVFLILIGIVLAVFYLNKVTLPVKIKSLIIHELSQQTGKKVSLSSIQFNLFKGLVLRKLVIYDDISQIISVKEASCTFLIAPVFKKQIIIPRLRLISAEVFLERRADNTFNLPGLFAKKEGAEKPKQKFTPLEKPLSRERSFLTGFTFLVSKINIISSRINFQDDTTLPVFTKILDNLNLSLSLSLARNLKFNLDAQIPANPKISLKIQGEYKIPARQLLLKAEVKDLSPKEFLVYYQNTGITFPEGLISAALNVDFKDNLVTGDLNLSSRNLLISGEKISAKLNSNLKAILQYQLEDKQLSYSGGGVISSLDISGFSFVDTIKDIRGSVKFNNAGLSADKLTAYCWGVPLEVKLNLSDFKNPLLNLDIASSKLDLESFKEILREKFKFTIPIDIQGKGNLSLRLETKIPSPELPQIDGKLNILDANLKLLNLSSPFEHLSGQLEFSANQLKIPELNFEYLATDYKLSGILADFKAPNVRLNLSSRDLYVDSLAQINGNLIKLTKCAGRYLNSEFSFVGDIDLSDPNRINTNINAGLNLNLIDLYQPLKKFKDKLDLIRPSGIVHAQINLVGSPSDFKSCRISANLFSSAISARGLKSQDFLLKYNQAEGIIDIPLAHLVLYDGIVEASGKMNLVSQNLPYWINFGIQRLKIEKLKLDTPLKDKDISGIIRAQGKLSGFSNDLSKLSGAGSVYISDGKLWELNLFQGLGSLIFISDFSRVIFNEGDFGFLVKDKFIFTDNLKLKSNLADISGSAKIGFDGALDASLNVEVSDKIPSTGTFRDVTTIIIGQAPRFGIIEITGSLKEPKYKFKTTVVDIIQGLKDTFLKK